MRALVIAAFSLLLGSSALAIEPAPEVRGAGHFGIGVGGGTAVAGPSMKYFLSDAFSVQAVAGGAGYVHKDYGSSALGVDADFLWEMPAITTAGDAFELGWAVGLGAWTWVGDPFWFGVNGALGLEFNLLPIPLDIVIEYRPSVRLVPDELYWDLYNFGGHVRFYFG